MRKHKAQSPEEHSTKQIDKNTHKNQGHNKQGKTKELFQDWKRVRKNNKNVAWCPRLLETRGY